MKLPTITKKQKEILHLIYKFRFLNRTQIQTLLQHKTYNRINIWLKDLTEKDYLGRKIETKSKLNNTPAIYYLRKNGIRYLRTQDYAESDYIKKLYQEKTRSVRFIENCTLSADCYINLLDKYGDKKGFNFYTRSEYSVNGIIKEIFPFFVFRRGEDQNYFVAEILPEKPRFYIRKRIREYAIFFTKSDWIKQEAPPTILFICPNNEIEEYITKKAKLIFQEENADNLEVKTTTIEQIQDLGIAGDIWGNVEVE